MKLILKKITPSAKKKDIVFVDVLWEEVGVNVKGCILRKKPDGNLYAIMPKLMTEGRKPFSPITIEDAEKQKEFLSKVIDLLKESIGEKKDGNV